MLFNCCKYIRDKTGASKDPFSDVTESFEGLEVENSSPLQHTRDKFLFLGNSFTTVEQTKKRVVGEFWRGHKDFNDVRFRTKEPQLAGQWAKD